MLPCAAGQILLLGLARKIVVVDHGEQTWRGEKEAERITGESGPFERLIELSDLVLARVLLRPICRFVDEMRR